MCTQTVPPHAHYSADEWVADEQLDPVMRTWLRRCMVPRAGLDGRVYWAADELSRGRIGG